MIKKTLAILLALCVVLGLMAGCGASAPAEPASAASQAEPVAESVQAEEAAPPAEPEAQEPAEDAEEPEEASAEEPAEEPEEERVLGPEGIVYTPVDLPLVDEPTTYTLWYGEPFTQYVDDPMEDVHIFGQIRDLTGIGFDISVYTIDTASERFQLLFAADDLPNIITDAMSYYTNTIDNAVFEDEFLYDYSGDLERMPNYKSTLDAYPEAKKTLTSGESGAMVSFPEMYRDIGDITGYMIRKDLLDATGMDVPETYDELHDMLLAIYNETGAAIEFSASGGDAQLGAGFGINTELSDSDLDGLYVVDGEVRMGLLQPEFKDYLEMAKQWYSEGLIHRDFMSQDRGDLGPFFTGQWSTIIFPPEIYNAAVNVLGVETVGMPMPVMNKGDEIHICGNQTSCLMDSACWSINSNVEAADVENIEKLVDWMYSEEGSLVMNWGEEGFSYTMENGEPKYTDLIVNNPDGFTYAEAAYLYATANRTRLPFLSDYDRCFADFNQVQWDMVDLFTSQCDHTMDYPLGAVMTNPQKERYNEVASDIATYISENVLQFILGQKDMREWDSFIDTVKSMGVDTAIEVKQEAYDDYLNS